MARGEPHCSPVIQLMFEFDLENPHTWRNFHAPYLRPTIPLELMKIGGMNLHGQPRLRAVWGGSEEIYFEGDEVVEAGYYLKYHLTFTAPKLMAYEYRDGLTGEKKQVSTHIALPDDVIVTPLYFQEEIGKPRWIVEMWHDAGDCGGIFDREGYYHLLTVEGNPINAVSGMGPYREI